MKTEQNRYSKRIEEILQQQPGLVLQYGAFILLGLLLFCIFLYRYCDKAIS